MPRGGRSLGSINRHGFLDRFWSKVDVRGPDDCWPWLRGVNGKGYANFRVRGSGKSDGLMLPAHVVAYELQTGEPVPAGFQIDHMCTTKLCQNARHMVVRTAAEHTARHNQLRKGEKRKR